METMHSDWGIGIGLGMWILWIVLIVVIVVFLKVVFGAQSDRTPSDLHEDPLGILKTRYAQGEIDEEEFEQRKNILEK